MFDVSKDDVTIIEENELETIYEMNDDFIKRKTLMNLQNPEITLVLSQIKFIVPKTMSLYNKIAMEWGFKEEEIPTVFSHFQSNLVFIQPEFQDNNPNMAWRSVLFEVFKKLHLHWIRGMQFEDKKRLEKASNLIINELLNTEYNTTKKGELSFVDVDENFQVPDKLNLKGKTMEDVYKFLEENEEQEEQYDPGNSGTDSSEINQNPLNENGTPQGDGEEDSDGESAMSRYKSMSKKLDKNEIQQMVKQGLQDKMEKSQGTLSGEYSETLRKLNYTKKQLSKRIKNMVAKKKVNAYTYASPYLGQYIVSKLMGDPKKGYPLPSEAPVQHELKILMYVDTSGSMEIKTLEKTVAMIESIAKTLDNYIIDIVYSDTGDTAKTFRISKKYPSNEEIYTVYGRGGTDLTPLYEYLIGERQLGELDPYKDYDGIVVISDFYVSEREIQQLTTLDQKKLLVVVPDDYNRSVDKVFINNKYDI